MMLGIGHLAISLRVALVVVPVALYFLILGLLNSRSSPQLLRGRRDFALLIVALCPLLAFPVLYGAQESPAALGAVVAAVVAALVALSPPRGSWVIYNITSGEALEAVGAALAAAGLPFRREGSGFCSSRGGAAVQLSAFPLLRNVSVRLTGVDGAARRCFEAALARRLASIPAETTPMTMALLLVAAAMLVAPLAMIAPRAGEIVRILSGMLY